MVLNFFRYRNLPNIIPNIIARLTSNEEIKRISAINYRFMYHFIGEDSFSDAFSRLVRFLREIQKINCPTVLQIFWTKPRRIVVLLDRATPTVVKQRARGFPHVSRRLSRRVRLLNPKGTIYYL